MFSKLIQMLEAMRMLRQSEHTCALPTSAANTQKQQMMLPAHQADDEIFQLSQGCSSAAFLMRCHRMLKGSNDTLHVPT